jgi:hypothetical protein
MTHLDFLIDNENYKKLEEISYQIFYHLGIDKFEERESSNYINGEYFIGYSDDGDFRISLSDHDVFDDLKYWISCEFKTDEYDKMLSKINIIIREKMLLDGFQVCRLDNFGTYDEVRVEY